MRATTIAIPWPFLATKEGASWIISATSLLLAAVVGLIAGLGMTVAQEFTTVPLILKAEVFEQAEEAKAPPAHEHEPKLPAAQSMSTRKAGRRKTASSGPPSRLPPTSSPAIGFALAAHRGERACRRHRRLASRRVLGLRGLRRVHAGTWSRAAARASGHAGGRARAAANLVGGDGSLHRRSYRAPGLWPVGPRRGRGGGSARRAAYHRRAAAREP